LGSSSAVVVDDLDIFGSSFIPAETYSPLVVDPDAPLPGAVALQRFKPISGRNPEIVNSPGGIDET